MPNVTEVPGSRVRRLDRGLLIQEDRVYRVADEKPDSAVARANPPFKPFGSFLPNDNMENEGRLYDLRLRRVSVDYWPGSKTDSLVTLHYASEPGNYRNGTDAEGNPTVRQIVLWTQESSLEGEPAPNETLEDGTPGAPIPGDPPLRLVPVTNLVATALVQFRMVPLVFIRLSLGKINNAFFRGYSARHVMFTGFNYNVLAGTGDNVGVVDAEWHFVARSTPWIHTVFTPSADGVGPGTIAEYNLYAHADLPDVFPPGWEWE
jgi:hypothetical protein